MYLQCTTTHFVQSGGFLKGSSEKKKRLQLMKDSKHLPCLYVIEATPGRIAN